MAKKRKFKSRGYAKPARRKASSYAGKRGKSRNRGSKAVRIVVEVAQSREQPSTVGGALQGAPRAPRARMF